MQAGARIKSLTFDAAKIIAAEDAADRRGLDKAGAFIRRRSKSSIRKRKAIAAPGMPPSSHLGILKDLIQFAYDPATKSEVIGPVRARGGKAPGVLERGGQERIKTMGREKNATYAPHPFMGPALRAETNAGTIPTQWSASLRG